MPRDPKAATKRRKVVRERRPEERPQELLDAALQVFAERGYRAATLDDVAVAAGVTKGAIYHYFEGKDDLLHHAVKSRMRFVRRDVEAILAEGEESAAVRIRLILRRVWQYFREPNWIAIFRMVIGELRRDFPDLTKSWLDDGPVYGWSLLEALIREGQGTGEFRRDMDARVAARAVVASLTMQIVFQEQVLQQPLLDPDRVFNASLDIFFHGVLQPLAAR